MTIVGALELDRTLPSHGNKGKIVSTIPTVKNDFSVAIAVESFQVEAQAPGKEARITCRCSDCVCTYTCPI